MEEVKVLKKNLEKAYEEGCTDVKKTLRLLFPILMGYKTGDVYRKVENNYTLMQDEDEDVFYVRLGNQIILAPDGSTQWSEDELDEFTKDKTKV